VTVFAVTGHRPKKAILRPEDRNDLQPFARMALVAREPAKVITGMALGWDMAVAAACLELHLPYVAAVPFEGQERKWSPEDRKRYHNLLRRAESVEVISEHRLNVAYITRDEWMVDHCDRLLALWDGSKSGTGTTVNYAIKKRVPYENLWLDWRLRKL